MTEKGDPVLQVKDLTKLFRQSDGRLGKKSKIGRAHV